MGKVTLPSEVTQFAHGGKTFRITVEEHDVLPQNGADAEAVLEATGVEPESRPARRLAIRSFTIRDANTGERIFDSKDELEQLLVDLAPDLCGGKSSNGHGRRSVTLGRVNGRLLAYVHLDPLGGTAVLDLTNPYNPEFVDYHDWRVSGHGEDAHLPKVSVPFKSK